MKRDPVTLERVSPEEYKKKQEEAKEKEKKEKK
jgi:hypothetical protein